MNKLIPIIRDDGLTQIRFLTCFLLVIALLDVITKLTELIKKKL